MENNFKYVDFEVIVEQEDSMVELVEQEDSMIELMEKLYDPCTMTLLKNAGVVNISIDPPSDSVSCTWIKDDLCYTQKITQEPNGQLQDSSIINANLEGDALTEQAKSLDKKGYKQTEIADKLNKSQSTISRHLNK